MKIILIIITALVACSTSRNNYKISNGRVSVYKKTPKGEPTMDILSTGDTLVSTGDSIYVKRKRQWKTL